MVVDHFRCRADSCIKLQGPLRGGPAQEKAGEPEAESRHGRANQVDKPEQRIRQVESRKECLEDVLGRYEAKGHHEGWPRATRGIKGEYP